MSELPLLASNRRLWLEVLIIFSLGVVVGLSFNAQLVLDAFAGRLAPARVVPAPVVGAEGATPMALPVPVVLDEVRELLSAGALAVDARSPELFADGHIASAVSLPLGELDERLPQFQVSVPPQTVLILYCSGFGCPDSFDLGVRLLETGYTDVRVYEGGFPEWRDAGLAVEAGAP